MPCKSPPPLSDEELSFALDGEATPDVMAHLARCEECSARLAEARQVDQALAGTLLRWDCPTPMQLGDYHLGFAVPAQQRTIARHLELCARCSAEIEDLRVFDAEPQTAAQPATEVPGRPAANRLRAMAAQLLPRSPGMQMGAVRGAGDGPLIAQASAATIIFETRTDDQRVRITGQIADEAGEQARWDGALVELRQANALVATTFVDEVGGFTCPQVAAGETEVRITAEDSTWIIIEAVEL